MKTIKSKLSTLILCAAIIATAIMAAGCCATKYSVSSPDGKSQVKVSNYRFFWTTDSYAVNFNTNGTASIAVNKSATDSTALAAVAQGVVQGMVAGSAAAAKP